MAADALKVDVITTTALIAAAERILLSMLICLHGPFARRAKHFGGAFGSEAEQKFSRGLGQTTTDAGVAQVSTRPADASMTKEALHRSGIIAWRPRPNGKRSVVSTAGIRPLTLKLAYGARALSDGEKICPTSP
jgi:hypothetical protein